MTDNPSPLSSPPPSSSLHPTLLHPCHHTAPSLMSKACAQVYAACGYSSNGSIKVIQADQTVDTLYESGADYPGISGMWSIPPWPGAEFHSLLVLSFASGSRAMATGTHLHVMLLQTLVWGLCGRGRASQVGRKLGFGECTVCVLGGVGGAGACCLPPRKYASKHSTPALVSNPIASQKPSPSVTLLPQKLPLY